MPEFSTRVGTCLGWVPVPQAFHLEMSSSPTPLQYKKKDSDILLCASWSCVVAALVTAHIQALLRHCTKDSHCFLPGRPRCTQREAHSRGGESLSQEGLAGETNNEGPAESPAKSMRQ